MEEENDAIYISGSKTNIDSSVLDRLNDGKQKNDFISHYLNMVFTLNAKDRNN